MSSASVSGRPPDKDAIRKIVVEEATKAAARAGGIIERNWKSQINSRTGHYRRSITTSVEAPGAASGIGAPPNVRFVAGGNKVTLTVGTNLDYALWLEEGTGLFGPLKKKIVPKRAKALRFPAGSAGFTLAGRRRSGRGGAQASFVFAKSVKGIKPRRYAAQAGERSRAAVEREFAKGGAKALARIGKEEFGL